MSIPLVNPLVPSGAAYFAVSNPGETRKYAFIAVRNFTLLAFSSAVDVLRIANQLSQKPLYQWRVLSEDGRPVTSSSGVTVAVDGPLGELERDTSLFVCAGNEIDAAMSPRVVAQLQRHHRFGGVVGGICTGAIALASAGLLANRRFTLHWENQPGFNENFPALRPTPSKFEIDGRVITCGGGAAATDMILSLIARDHSPQFAAIVSEMCLRHVMIGSDTAQRSSIGALLHSRNPALISIGNLMSQHLEDTLSMEALAEASGYSRRHIERLFKLAVGMSPASYYRKLRLDHARSLLSSTDMSLMEIATATGFDTVSYFSKAFKAQFGVAPSSHGHRRKVKR